LDIYNTSYGKKKSWESNCQFDSWPQKGWESTRLPCVQMECDTPFEGFRQELQLCFRPHPNRRSQQDVMFPQSCGSPTVATPLWPSVGVKPNTPKVGDLESSGTPECLEFDKMAQNTSHWGVFGVIGKVLKRKYRKWPRIGHLDFCSPSYGQKKGRESNW